ncbi:MAG: RNA polymerase-binding protein DksA [Mailhella sp.]|nr:RNA polymerase-binding protein DksA [Mailhella sp.]
MSPEDLDYFRKLLQQMLDDMSSNGASTLEELTENQSVFADPTDRASAETDRAFTLRLRDRERQLIKKIYDAQKRIEDGTFGICQECGDEISIARLKARPVTTLCLSCKARQEKGEEIFGS